MLGAGRRKLTTKSTKSQALLPAEPAGLQEDFFHLELLVSALFCRFELWSPTGSAGLGCSSAALRDLRDLRGEILKWLLVKAARRSLELQGNRGQESRNAAGFGCSSAVLRVLRDLRGENLKSKGNLKSQRVQGSRVRLCF